ncbi:MAG: cytochrome ubiquinol oxidase subunit I, partial [Alphaproteobacteria bacterium]|nr:cytochrome ubiquinol oxidase subunit I [Alphaproteobacteria bacterium]
WLLALGTNLSALFILIANAWMQNPVGSKFNPDTMRMEVSNFFDVFFNPVAQVKFVHTVSAGYVTGAIFVLAISAWFMLKQRHLELASRSMVIAVSFGLASALSVVVLGDESGYTAGQNQKMKVAAIEAMWETEPAPAALTLFGIPDQEKGVTHFEVKIPWVLGLIATRSFDQPVAGINDLVEQTRGKIKSGVAAYKSLENHEKTENYDNLGYALLLKKYAADVGNATPEQIDMAAKSTVPPVLGLFWSFRFMVGIGVYFIALFVTGFYLAAKRKLVSSRRFQLAALCSLPLPWVASSLGWIVAEVGRQPWTIDGVLPTFLSASSTAATNVWFSLVGFVVFYSALLIVDIFLIARCVRMGPKMEGADYA